MIQLMCCWCLMLSLDLQLTDAGDKENQTNTWITKEKKHQISVSLKFVTLTEVVELSCESSALVEGQQCLFHVDSEFKELGRSNASHNHCSLPVRGSELLGWKHRGLWSKVTVHCHYEEEEGIHSPPSKNVTVVVWNTNMLTKYIIGCMALIGFIILLAVFIFCITCLLSLKAKRNGCLVITSDQTLQGDPTLTTSDTTNPAESPQEKETIEEGEDDLCYATVSHAGAPPSHSVKFEQGHDYATVVIH
ncbi:uncharacterized protein LOC121583330 isoform X2 [Coregonus clupeaformis]|uniref:uncharacterized protein LOC121583330 isoform X2 n=1 Tax=Coregonus clupeaformis TaxID=59861 RepID=UPI001BE05A8E|nr:uncharacterized protein LOC121583330 isoform X2 [Coregonus clupeaformis]